jgi:CBS domain-containing protein
MADKEDFLSLYNRLDSLCRTRYHLEDRNESAIMLFVNELRGSDYYRYREYGNDLDSLRNLRNSLIHCNQINGEDMFSINKNTIIALQKIIDVLVNPPKAKDVAIPFSSLFTTTLTSKALDVIQVMTKNGYSHVPVIDNKGHLIGVFSEGVLFSYLSIKGKVSLLGDETINDFASYLPLNAHQNERYIFVPRETYLEQVVKEFEESKSQTGKRLGLVFISEHGLENEKILGALALGTLFVN